MTAEEEAIGPAPHPSLRTQAIRGSTWTIVGYGTAMVLRLAVNILLTHLLFPEAFGLLALVMVFVAGLQMFSDVGIGPSIIRSPRGEERAFLDTAWTIQVARGLLLWLGACALAWPASVFYGDPRLITLLPVAGLTTVIGGFISTAPTVLNRRMQIGRITVYEMVWPIPGIAATCLWAYLSPTVWALVGGQLIQQAGRVFFSYLLIPGHRDRLRWDRSAAVELFHFGRWIFMSTLVTFLSLQADKIMLGKLLTLDRLGVYGIALGLATLPQDIMSRLTSAVQFPALSRHALDQSGLMFHWLRRSRDGLLWMALAMTLGIAVGGTPFFALMYDSRFQDAAWIAQLVSVTVWVAMLQVTCDRALLALGDSRTLAMSNLAKVVTTIAACLIGFRLDGLPGFLWGMPVGALAGYLSVVIALKKRGYLTLRADIEFSVLFGAVLAGSWFLERRVSGISVWHRSATATPLDLGVALMAVVVLVPLTAYSAYRLYRIVVVR